jgi:tetratricopeptide (TPR) repeat protein
MNIGIMMSRGAHAVQAGRSGFAPSLNPIDAAMNEALAGDALSQRGDLPNARLRYEAAVRLNPAEAIFHWLLGLCDWRLGAMDQAGTSLQASVRLNPQFAPAQAALGQWYLGQGMVEQALVASGKSVQLAPDNIEHLRSRAWTLEAAGDLDGAWEILSRLIAAGQANVSVARLYARLARWRGHQNTALSLVIELLRTGGQPPVEQSGLHFAAADLLDSLGRYDEAFAHAARGNALRRPPYDPEMHRRTFDRIIEYFTPQRMRSLPRAGFRSGKPVFIVGMPRTGTSLVEQILASHPLVHGAGELDFIFRMSLGMADMLGASLEHYPEFLQRVSVAQLDGLAQTYLAPLAGPNPHAARITDKMPLNFLHLGTIACLFPNARVIHCRRDPMDTCLSCHMTAFNVGNDFKYDLHNLGLFYKDYQRLMAHWKTVLDLAMLEVCYEDLVTDPEPQSRRMVEFLGLDWDDRCLRFHDTQRPAVTSSVVQVRQPMYKSSIQRWRHYERHLTQLKDVLHPPAPSTLVA